MSDAKVENIPIKSSVDVIIARRKGMNMALDMGFPKSEATKIAVVISELTRNIVLYTDGGNVILSAHSGLSKYFEVVARDTGPGITNLDQVLAGGYTTSKGLGKGVSGSKRLMDTFDISTTPGVGTTIKATKRLN